MKDNNSVFHQLLKVIPRHQYQNVVDHHNGNHRARTLSLDELAGRVSIRDRVEHFNASHNHHYHLGVSRIKRSLLSDANNRSTASISRLKSSCPGK